MINNNSHFNKQQHFGFRKLSIGLTAVALSTVFLLGTAQTTHADELKGSDEPTQQQLADDPDAKQSSTLDSSAQTNENQNDKLAKKSEVSPELKTEDNSSQTKPVIKSTTQNDVTGSITAQTADNTDISTNNHLQAGYNNVKITASITGKNVTNPQSTNFTINIGNTSEKNGDQAWIIEGFKTNETTNIGKDYQMTYQGDGNFNVKILDKDLDIENLNFNYIFNVVGNKNYLGQTDQKTASLPVTIKYNNKIIAQQTFEATIVPGTDYVSSDELAHIWPHGLIDDPNASQFIPADCKDSAKLLQYWIDWNLGEISPLENVQFTETFSPDQQLLPDTIKVFRVYNGILKNEQTSERLPWGQNTYSEVTGKQLSNGLYANEDTAFEEFLRDHLYVTTDGQTQPITYSEFKKQFEQGNLPTVTKIEFKVNGPFEYRDSQGQLHNWSVNSNNPNDPDTHSVFFIQMDTLLPDQIPSEWTIPGEGPSSEISTDTPKAKVSASGENGSAIYTGFNNNGSGYIKDSLHSAELYFADVTDPNNIINLGGKNDIPAFLSGSNQETATLSTPIKFTDVENIIATLQKLGYTLVGASIGQHISGKYDGSTLYTSSKYDSNKYGNYGWSPKAFTLNFEKINKPDKPVQPTNPQPTQPTTPVNPTTPDTPSPTTPTTPSVPKIITDNHPISTQNKKEPKIIKLRDKTISLKKNIHKHNVPSTNTYKYNDKGNSSKTNILTVSTTTKGNPSEATLPQTGTSKHNILAIFGLLFLSLSSLLGLESRKSKKN